jgi:hypothetical protein
MNEDNALRQCDCDALNRVLQRSADALALGLACKECGWDVDVYISKLQEQIDIATKTKAKFFPNQP